MGSGMNMTGSHASMVMPGGTVMSSGGGHGTTNILPQWLAIVWTLVFIGILVIHARHVLDSHAQRRYWHSGHVLMAFGMIFMFAPASIDHFDIPAGFWQLAFANAAGIVLAWILAQALSRQVVNVLWIVLATDLAAMVYMWSPSGLVGSITWLLVVYFVVQAVLWATNLMRQADDVAVGRRFSVSPGGAIAATAVQPLVCDRDLRVSLGVMTLGMAYMLAAMQLLT
jgi:hypothetical protein